MDASVYRAVNDFASRTPWLHTVAVSFAKGGIVVFGLLLLVGWYLARRDSDLAELASVFGAGAAVFVALGIAQLIGHAFDRARPYAVMPGAHVLVARTSDFSFPSDHATAVGAVAVGLLLSRRPLGVVAAALAVGMAVTRVYVGAHYPSDVAAGLVVGGVTAAVVCRAAVTFLAPVLRRLRRTFLRIFLVARP